MDESTVDDEIDLVAPGGPDLMSEDTDEPSVAEESIDTEESLVIEENDEPDVPMVTQLEAPICVESEHELSIEEEEYEEFQDPE